MARRFLNRPDQNAANPWGIPQGDNGMNPMMAALMIMLRNQQQAAPQETAPAAAQPAAPSEPIPNPYLTLGANAPYLSGLTPMQRYLDIGARQSANMADAQAESRQRIAAAAAAGQHPTNAIAMYGSGGVAGADPSTGEEFQTPIPAGPHTIMGLDPHEWFQRKANATGASGGENKFAVPEPGYRGTKMTKPDMDKWKKVMSMGRGAPKE